MKSKLFTALLIVALTFCSCKSDKKTTSNHANDTTAQKQQWAIVIHGGAGGITRENITPELDKEYRAGLQVALNTGKKILAEGGSALDAVEQTIRTMARMSLMLLLWMAQTLVQELWQELWI